MYLSMFSMTIMASSTTKPVARVIPKSVKVLIENPNNFKQANVPINEIGIVMAGIRVERQFWRNRKIAPITRRMAIPRVQRSSLMDDVPPIKRAS